MMNITWPVRTSFNMLCGDHFEFCGAVIWCEVAENCSEPARSSRFTIG